MHMYVCDFAYFFLILAYVMKDSAGLVGSRYSILLLVGFSWPPCHITAHKRKNFKESFEAFYPTQSGAAESSASIEKKQKKTPLHLLRQVLIDFKNHHFICLKSRLTYSAHMHTTSSVNLTTQRNWGGAWGNKESFYECGYGTTSALDCLITV